MKKERLPFRKNSILLSILLPVLGVGLIISGLSISYQTPPLLSFIQYRTDAELKLATNIGLTICENHLDYLLELRLESDPEMNTTLKKEAIREIKGISKRLHKINMLIIEDNQTVLGSSLDLKKEKLAFPKLTKGKSDIITENFWGDPVRIDYQYFPFWNWHIVSLISEKDYMAPILLAKKIAYSGTFGVLIVVLCTLFLVFYFFVNLPLKRVIRATEGIAEGKLSRVDLKRKDEIGQLGHSFNSMVDSLNEKNIEVTNLIEELKISEDRFRTIFQTSPDVIAINRLDNGIFIDINEGFTSLYGYSREDVIGKSALEVNIWHDPKDRKKFEDELKKNALVKNVEAKYRLKDGSTRTGLISARIIELGGEPHTLSIVRDVQELKKAEQTLRESEERLNTILDSILTGVAVIEAETHTIVDVNPVAVEMIGAPKEQIIGHVCHKYICPAEQGACPITDLGQKVDKSERVLITTSGEEVAILKNVNTIILNGKEHLLDSFVDITDRKQAEEEKKKLEAQLQRAQKMEAIGTLAGGVAHDLNNVLSGIVSYPELLLMEIPDDSPLRKPILTIQRSGEKAAAIVQDLLTLARRGVAVKEAVNLNTIISEYLKSPEHQNLLSFHPSIHVKTNLEVNLLNVSGSPAHLSKSIMNLISNAAEAMPDGGEICIATENRYIDKPIRGYDNVEQGDYVTLTVSDTGVGISIEDMEKIFEPFYTKKKMGRSGTGLGMAVVWGTIKDHTGYIDAQSAEGKGTTFTLYFPVTRKELSKDEALFSIDDYKGKGESILVVDDVEEQREIASQILKKLGYSVNTVSSGEEAVDYLKDNPTDLLILDMIMDPGIDGLETYTRILEFRPGQKAIIVSGFSETDRVKLAQRLGAETYVKKPFLLEKIGIAVRDELCK